MPMPFDVVPGTAGRHFRVTGELDASVVNRLYQAVGAALEEEGDLVLDLAGLSFMDSSGIRFILNTCRRMQGRGDLILHSPVSIVSRLIGITGVQGIDNLQILMIEPAGAPEPGRRARLPIKAAPAVQGMHPA